MPLRILKRTGLFILNFIEYRIAPFILIFLFISLFMQVILRYVFNYPSPELFEISQYMFIWVVFLGADVAQRFGSHMKFNVLYEKFPRKVQLIFDLAFNTFFSVMLLVTFFPTWEDLMFYKFMKSTVLKIPWTFLFLCFPVFMILMLIHNIIWMYKDGREFFTGKKPVAEVKPWD
jgi:TRAP-type C4-dicarboxylate transport system permease small subunit